MDPSKSDIVGHSDGLVAGLIALATTIAVTLGGALRFNARIAELERKGGVSDADLDEVRDKCAEDIRSLREEMRLALETAARRSRPMIEDDQGSIRKRVAEIERRLTEVHHQVIAIVAVMRGADALGPPPTTRRR